jgi:lysophospholipase L1-like esterase
VRQPALPPPPENAPGAAAVRLDVKEITARTWDDKLTIEWLSDRPLRLTHIDLRAVDVPTVYLLGDSTVADQPFEPAASWGQMLPVFFMPSIAVANHAKSGATLKSFLAELRLDKVLAQLRPGDWVLIQFGHNDEKEAWPQTYVDAHTTYRDYLSVYVAEIRRHGATPILVTSPERRNFNDAGAIIESHGDYPAAVRAVASDLGVPCIDLHALSKQTYEALGPERAAGAFNDGGRDKTHHNDYGAYLLAHAVATELRHIDVLLKANMREFPDFDARDPLMQEHFHLQTH